jgi:3-hydroxyisobutyrate dehydrogenase
MSDTVIGMIGLGRMGGPIAQRLAAAGHTVLGYDAAGSAERAAEGVTAVDSIAEVADACDTVALSLPRPEISVSVIREIVDRPDRRTRDVIDLSTVGLEAAATCADIAAQGGLAFVDAPLSGGVAGARTGEMAMMAAAPAEVVERLRPLLQEIAHQLFVVGTTAGHGQAMKLLNNYVSGTALAATMEAVVFGQQVGLDLEQVVEVLNASSGRTTASTEKLPRAVVPGTYDFGFAAAAMRKDVGLFLQGATGIASPHRLADASDALWDRFVGACPDEDFTYLHRYLQEGGE